MNVDLNFNTDIEEIISIRRITVTLLVYFSIDRAIKYADSSRKN